VHGKVNPGHVILARSQRSKPGPASRTPAMWSPRRSARLDKKCASPVLLTPQCRHRTWWRSRQWGMLNTQQQLDHEDFDAFQSVFAEPMSQSKCDAVSALLSTDLANLEVCRVRRWGLAVTTRSVLPSVVFFLDTSSLFVCGLFGHTRRSCVVESVLQERISLCWFFLPFPAYALGIICWMQ
jgi:hypothetical protein